MMLFRRAYLDDLAAIHQLALQSGIGITTLTKDSKLLEKRLNWTVDSFARNVNQPLNEYYFFVLEDTNTHAVVGTSAIEAATGYDSPFYSYKLSKRTRFCHSLNIRSDYHVLSLVNDNQGKSEICTLFLNPEYRRHHNGLLLSRARFLFMAQFPARFARIIIAEMRGISDDEGRSPFWDNVGNHFFHMNFSEADRLTIATNKQFIADLMPRNPLYVKLLAKEAQNAIGHPHPSSLPAMNILINEGFRYNNYVDIFDAGPTIEAPVEQIRSIKTSKTLTVHNISDAVSSKKFIIANTELNFKATISEAVVNQRGQCIICKKTAELLQVKLGDTIRLTPLHFTDPVFTTEINND